MSDDSGRAPPKCENCEASLPDGTACRCDTDGLWFCLECWNALAEDFGLIPKT